MVAGFVSGGDLGTRGVGAEREAVGDSLRGDQDVGGHAIMLDGEHFSSAAETGLDLVGDKQNSVLVEDLLHLAEIVFWRDKNSTFTHDWLGDECCDVSGGGKANNFVD